MRPAIACVLASAATLGIPRPAQARTADAPQAAVHVDVTALPDEGVTKQVAQALRSGATDVLRDGGIEITEGSDTVVSISIRRYGEDGIHYEATTGIDTGDGGPLEAARTFSCELCTDGELEAKVTRDVARLSGWLSGHSKSGAPPRPRAVVAPDKGHEPPRTHKPAPRARPFLIFGATATSLGAASIIAGSVIVSRGMTASLADNDVSERFRDLRRTGLAVLGTGGVLLVVGLPFMLTDLVKRGRSSRTDKAIAWSPTWFKGPALSLKGRF